MIDTFISLCQTFNQFLHTTVWLIQFLFFRLQLFAQLWHLTIHSLQLSLSLDQIFELLCIGEFQLLDSWFKIQY